MSKPSPRGVHVKRKTKRRSLSDCATERQICDLPRSSYSCANHWLLDDGYEVTLTAQKIGEAATQSISLPRGVFRRLVAYWQKKQRVTHAP